MVAFFRLVGNYGGTISQRRTAATRCATYQPRRCPKSSGRLSCVVSAPMLVYGTENVHAMAATAHGLLVSNTLCRTKPMMASCTTQRTAEVTSALPTPRWRVVEMRALKRINARPRATLPQVKVVESPGVGASMKASRQPTFEFRPGCT